MNVTLQLCLGHLENGAYCKTWSFFCMKIKMWEFREMLKLLSTKDEWDIIQGVRKDWPIHHCTITALGWVSIWDVCRTGVSLGSRRRKDRLQSSGRLIQHPFRLLKMCNHFLNISCACMSTRRASLSLSHTLPWFLFTPIHHSWKSSSILP